MTDNTIGVIVPVYNVEQYLKQCVESIINQSYKNIEIILIDDGSPDRCPLICDNYAKKDKRVKVLHKQNSGLVSAWISGLNALSDSVSYIVFVDSDDWISVEYIEKLVEKQEEYNTDIVITKINRMKGNKEIERNFIISSGYYDIEKIKEEVYSCMLNTGNFEQRGLNTSRCGKLIRKNLILNNLKYCMESTTYAEDLNIIFPIFLDMKSMYILDDNRVIYYYRVNANSMIQAYDKNMRTSIEHVHKSLLRASMDKGKQFMADQIYADYLAASIQYFKNELKNPDGLKVCKKNIRYFSTDQMLIKSIRITEWRKYRWINRIIIKCLRNFDFIHKNFITLFLFIMMKIKLTKMRGSRCR